MHDSSISKKVSATVAHAETSMATTTPDVVNEIIYGDTNTQGKETSNIRKYGIYGGFFIFLVVVVVVFRLLQKNRRSSDGDSSEDFEIVE
jgi:drug/metabolite transporter superfamily protein YnfA